MDAFDWLVCSIENRAWGLSLGEDECLRSIISSAKQKRRDETVTSADRIRMSAWTNASETRLEKLQKIHGRMVTMVGYYGSRRSHRT